MSIYRATLRGAVLSGVAFGALTVSNSAAWAQQTPAPTPAPAPQTNTTAEPEQKGEIIIVTGSRLRQENFDSPNPILTVGAQDIENKQVANAVDIIEDIPLIGIGTNNRGTQTQNGDSFAFPDILDLGTQRTLTLLNGRRVVASNPGSVFVPGNASGSQVDLSVFNPSMIERVEVLAGTGGAIYGADAVGGVVNLITKNDYNGLSMNLQGGMTEIGDGEQLKFGVTYGTDLFEGKGHIMVTGDYFHQEVIGSTADSNARYGGSGITNAFEGARRNAFSASAAADALRAGTAFTSPFQAQGSDGIGSVFYGPLSLQNPLITSGGTLLTGQSFGAGFANTTNLVPATPVNSVLSRPDVNGFTFFAPSALSSTANSALIISTLAPGTNVTGLSAAQLNTLALAVLQANRPTPLEYYTSNPNLNPLLFAGTFGTTRADTGATNFNNGAYTTVANTDPLTNAIFPRIAQPYTFAANGNLVPLNIGNIRPQGRLGQTYGGAGYDAFARGHNQFQAGTDRVALASVADYDFNDNLRWNSNWMYTYAKFDQTGGAVTHSPGGSVQAGTLAVPIYIDQNPYLNTQALATINSIATTATGGTGGTGGQPIQSVGGQRVMYLGRALDDLLGGGVHSELEVQNFQITNALEGDFTAFTRDFYWDVAYGYGRSDQKSTRPDFLDQEFAMATDVVIGPGGQAVCRQQTLSAPESVIVRNPALSGSITGIGTVPTAAQVAACKPLNLFGSGAASAAARNYVIGDANVHALNTLQYFSGSIGSDIWDLPAGPVGVGLSAERRKEGFEFEPSRNTQTGAGRTAPQARGEGSSTFTEYGYEVHVPLFGGDFTFPLLERLDVSYAQRQVQRDTESITVSVPISSTDDDTFNYSINYSPVPDLTLRAAKSRTVRSPSLVELVGPFTIAFSNLAANTNPCVTSTIDTGPAPATRRANCVAAVQALGIAPTAAAATTFLATFNGTAGTRPANASGNPGVVNEEGNTYTLGFTYEPSFVPNLVIASDFFSVDLTNEIGLFGPANFTTGCFDQPSFPNSQFGGTFACDTFLFGVPTGPGGQFVIPATNALTGRPGAGGVLAGSTAAIQQPFELSFVGFANLNAASREFRGVNTEIRYNFDLVDLPFLGQYLADAGELYLRASHFHTQRYDTNAGSVDKLAGEHTNPEHEVRFDIRQKVGNFDHTLQAYWNSRTVTTVETAKSLYPEQSGAFIAPAFWFYNYTASYKIDDRFTIRGTINNLFNTTDPRGAFGVGNQYDAGIGREFVVGVTATF